MKKTISEMIEGYIKRHANDEEKLLILTNAIESYFEDPSDAAQFWSAIEGVTDEVTPEMIHEAAEKLKRRDGSHSSIKWTKEETDVIEKQYDVKNKLGSYNTVYDSCKFWFAMNYIYAVHFNINRTINGYVDLAVDELANKNVCFDKIIKDMVD